MKYIFLILPILVTQPAFSQTIQEALRYSILNYGATARNMSVGGTMGAFGTDVSAGALNPAGFAEFRKSEFSLSTNLFSSSIDATLEESRSENFAKTSFGLHSAALVFTHIPIASAWKTSNFVIGYNRIANFNSEFGFNGETQGSMTDRFVALADGLTPDELDDFTAGPAYVVGAIYDFDEDNIYETDFDGYNGDVPKSQTIDTRGGLNELVLGWGGNLDNIVSIGLSLGLPFLSYEETKTYMETDESNNIDFFNEMLFEEYLRTSGFGVNGKIGLILKPQKQIRISASFHSPTKFFVTDDFYTDITYSYTDQEGAQTFTEPSPEGNFKYRLTTPWRAIFGAGYLFGYGDLTGFMGAEVEYIDYSSNKYNLTAESNNPVDRLLEMDLNDQIKDQFASTLNWRIGAEIAYQTFRFRAGYRFNGSPYNESSLLEGNVFTTGIGYRGNAYYVDLGLQYQTSEQEYIPYYVADDSRLQIVSRDNQFANLILTFGFKI